MESLECHQERYKKMELKLAEEKERIQTLQAQLDMSTEDVISDFQKCVPLMTSLTRSMMLTSLRLSNFIWK